VSARAATLTTTRAALVAGPLALAFFSGGFFDRPRTVALVVAGALLALLCVAAPARDLVPRRTPVLVALGAAVLYAGWIALSATWAPVADFAGDDAERALLYAVVLAAATIALRPPAALRALEPAVAAAATIVVGYGLAGRLLPGIVTQHPQASALGRLDQPLTYWNAMGALAAIGLVLCARMTGDPLRDRRIRAVAAAAAVPLGMGCYLSFSRGALAALAAGLVALVVLAPSRATLRGIAIVVSAGAAAALAAGLSPAVRALEGSMSAREREGALVLAVALLLMAAAAALGRAHVTERPLTLPRRAPWIAAALIAALLVVPIVAARGAESAPATGATAKRLGSLGSHRYDYWQAALGTGADHPVAGVGASGFRVEWLRRREIDDVVRDAHSLELETFAELGLVGVALLAALLGGVALSARGAHRADPLLTAGPVAALVAWAFHSAIDWDWEMPGLTLFAVVLAGGVLARAGAQSSSAIRGASRLKIHAAKTQMPT
jgi:hypothetical protein